MNIYNFIAWNLSFGSYISIFPTFNTGVSSGVDLTLNSRMG